MPIGVMTELVEGDVYHWGALMAGALLGSLPVAILYSFFVEYYVPASPARSRNGAASLVAGPIGPLAATGVKWASPHEQWRNPMSVQETLRDQVTKNRVVLYMKGTPQFPQCGFSAPPEILKRCGVDEYFSVNVLAEPEIRQGIKEFANWPTIPQLYVNGEFVGGCDIIREMYASGELQKFSAAVGLNPRGRNPQRPARDGAVIPGTRSGPGARHDQSPRHGN